MHHAITIGGLLLALGILGGLLAAALGLLMLFAAGMSDAGDDGTGGKGCVTALVGIAVAIACIVGMFFL
jgi:hypothetical protein